MVTFPGYPLDVGRTNATPQSSRHPQDHNEERAAINDLQAQILTLNPDPQGGMLGSRWVFDGDSITIQGSTGYTPAAVEYLVPGGAWPRAMAAAANGHIEYVWNAAVGGHTSAQRLAAFETDVAPYRPEVVMLTIGTNDIGTSLTMASWLANLEAYRIKCLAIGARLVLGEIWPTDETVIVGPTRGAVTRAWNDALHAYARSADVALVPWNQMLADPTTGGWPAGWSADGIHPLAGIPKATIGDLGWGYIEPLCGPPVLQRPRVNSADMFTNGLMLTMSADLITPLGLGSAAVAGGGTLAVATYDYVVAVHSYFGESLPSASTTVVVGVIGHVDLTWTQVTGRRGYSIYRRVSGVGTYKRIATFDTSTNVNATFTDTGFADDGTEPATVNSTSFPTAGTAVQALHATAIHERNGSAGQPFFAEAGVNGKIFRQRPYRTLPATAPGDWVVSAAAITAGQVYEFSVLCRYSGPDTGYPRFILRFDPTTVNETVMELLPLIGTDWNLVHGRVTVPAGKTSMRFTLAGTVDIVYVDWAEPRLVLMA